MKTEEKEGKMTKDNLWKKYTEKQKSQVFKFSDGYKEIYRCCKN